MKHGHSEVSATSCIYCGLPLNASGEGDHTIPLAYGEFFKARNFFGLCDSCHSKCDQGAAQLLRCGIESEYRDYATLRSERHAKRRSGMSKGAMGAPAPSRTVEIDGRHLPVRQRHGNSVEPSDCIVFRRADGSEATVSVFPRMGARALARKLLAAGWVEGTEVFVSVAEERHAEIVSMLETLIPRASYRETSVLAAGVHRVKGVNVYTVNTHYFRAIAKIAFHHYLCWSTTQESGREPRFDEIRRFITTGMAAQPPVVSVGDDSVPPPESPADVAHIVCFGRTADGLVGLVHLFANEDTKTRPWLVRLTHDEISDDEVPDVWGHAYVYCDIVDGGKPYAGVVREIRIRHG